MHPCEMLQTHILTEIYLKRIVSSFGSHMKAHTEQISSPPNQRMACL